MTQFRTGMIRGLVLWGWMLLFTASAIAQIPAQHSPPVLVNDFAKLFSPEDSATLERKLVAFNDTKSVQIVVITQNDVKQELNQYTTEIGEQWGIGQAGLDNGVLLFIDPKNRNAYIATGSGSEGWLPDILAKRIVDTYLVPAFKEDNYYKGVDDATGIIMGLVTGEYTEADVKSPKGRKKPGSWVTILIIGVIIVLFQIVKRRGGGRGGHGGGWIFTGGGFGGYSGGGGGFSGGGGGGFGGFGGGGFSGGGAGGSW